MVETVQFSQALTTPAAAWLLCSLTFSREFSGNKSRRSYLNNFNELGKHSPLMPDSFRALLQTIVGVQMAYLHSAKV